MTDRIATNVFRLVLRRTNGQLTEEQAAELLDLIQSAVPNPCMPKAKYRPAEIPDEVVEQVFEDIKQVVAANPAREQQLAVNPPTPDERAAAIAVQAERVKAAAARLAELVRLKTKAKETDE